MKKILMVLITLISFNSFAEELIKDEDVVKEETSIQVVEDETTENVINSDEIKEQSGKFVRLKVVGGIEGKIRMRDDDGKTTVGDRDNDYEALVEGVYRINEFCEVSIGTGVQKFGKLFNYYNGYYAIPLYFSTKYNLFKSPLYIKALGGIAYNIKSSGTSQFYSDLATVASYTGITKDDIKIKNGYYYGAGLGLDLGNFEIEALYSVNELEGKFDYTDGTTYKKKMDNNRVSLGISYAFEVGK